MKSSASLDRRIIPTRCSAHRRVPAGLALAVSLALGLLSPTAFAVHPPKSTPSPARTAAVASQADDDRLVEIPISEAEQRAALDYWTVERMQAAIESDRQALAADPSAAGPDAATGDDGARPDRIEVPTFNDMPSAGWLFYRANDRDYQTGNVSLYGAQTRTVGVTYWEAAAHGAWDAAQRD